MPTMPKFGSLRPDGGKRPAPQRDAKRFYDSAAWIRLRDATRTRRPLCADCPADDPRPATQVHHLVPVLERWDLRLDPANLTCLCDACHARRHKSGTFHGAREKVR